MKLEVEQGAADRHHWRLVVTTADLAPGANGLDRRLRVIGGGVRAKLDYAPRRRAVARTVRPAPATHPAPAPTTPPCSATSIGC